jgi:hypothetical protein
MNDKELTETLEALEGVLAREFRALVTLDGKAIEMTTTEKRDLDDKLRALGRPVSASPAVNSALQRIKLAAHTNQALLVHARACLQGALRITTGAMSEPPSYARSREEAFSPVRVNTRG